MILKDWDLQLTVDEVLRGQGADPAVLRARRPDIAEIAAWALKEGLPLLYPQVKAVEMEVKGVRHERLVLENGASGNGAGLSGPLIVQHLRPARRAILMACTIGPQLEDVVSELMHTDPVYGLALDGLGNAAIEALAIQACNYFERQAAGEGWEVSIPLSPGMVDWPVDPGQRQMFALLQPAEIGLHLGESLMMSPTKSLTQVLGLGPEMALKGRTCDYCSLKDTCRYQDHYV